MLKLCFKMMVFLMQKLYEVVLKNHNQYNLNTTTHITMTKTTISIISTPKTINRLIISQVIRATINNKPTINNRPTISNSSITINRITTSKLITIKNHKLKLQLKKNGATVILYRAAKKNRLYKNKKFLTNRIYNRFNINLNRINSRIIIRPIIRIKIITKTQAKTLMLSHSSNSIISIKTKPKILIISLNNNSITRIKIKTKIHMFNRNNNSNINKMTMTQIMKESRLSMRHNMRKNKILRLKWLLKLHRIW